MKKIPNRSFRQKNLAGSTLRSDVCESRATIILSDVAVVVVEGKDGRQMTEDGLRKLKVNPSKAGLAVVLRNCFVENISK